MTVSLLVWPIVRFASSSRSLSRSTAARREKIRLSHSSTCEKNSRCSTPACCRSLGVKNGVNCASHLRAQPERSCAVNESAISCRTAGSEQLVKALVDCRKRTPRWIKRLAIQRSEEHTSELQSLAYLVCRLLLEKKKKKER